ncbi:MAG: hypothetical protein R3B72_49790 [Polyangiaceae bacterium]
MLRRFYEALKQGCDSLDALQGDLGVGHAAAIYLCASSFWHVVDLREIGARGAAALEKLRKAALTIASR